MPTIKGGAAGADTPSDAKLKDREDIIAQSPPESKSLKQITSKDGAVKCVTAVPYPAEVVRQMRRAGYRVKEVLNG